MTTSPLVFSNKIGKRLRGVNLGGWLVLEKWMKPSLFEGMAAVDETSWCVEKGPEAEKALKEHWASFITEADFKWIAEHGLNAVRIPVGHWLFGRPYPYHPKYGSHRHPFVKGGVEILDQAMGWAEQHGLHVVLDLHAAPGCQNGFDNGGIKDCIDWPNRQEYVAYSLDFLERLAERYCKQPCLHAIEVLNEPHWDISTDLLKTYTHEGYRRIRRHCSDDVAVVFHDGFRPASQYNGFLREPEYKNVILDVHKYQCFTPEDKALSLHQHIRKAAIEWRDEADDIARKPGLWAYVGEWSLGLDLKVVSLWAPGPYNHALENMTPAGQHEAYKAYGFAQLNTFNAKCLGQFFWSYRTESAPAWSYRDCVELGWLPACAA